MFFFLCFQIFPIRRKMLRFGKKLHRLHHYSGRRGTNFLRFWSIYYERFPGSAPRKIPGFHEREGERKRELARERKRERRLFDLPGTIPLIDCFYPRSRQRRDRDFSPRVRRNSIFKFASLRARVTNLRQRNDIVGDAQPIPPLYIRNKYISSKSRTTLRNLIYRM